MDYYKNTILKQNILPIADYKVKISISLECENSSVKLIDNITKIIKNDYLPNFTEFSTGTVNLFSGSLVVLNDCLIYHFKKGLKCDLNITEGDNAVNLFGIFLTGLYSIVMERSKFEILMSAPNIISAHLKSHFKRFLIQNYSIKPFDDFKGIIDSISNFYLNNINYENLRIFCKKHSKLLRINYNKNSLLGFNNGYLIRIMNSFISIIPFDLCNLNPDNKEEKFPVNDKDILIVLMYYSLSHILDGIIPSIENIASSSFVGPELNTFEFGNIENLMKIFKLIKNKELKLIGIYLIRTALFFKNQRMYYQIYLAKFTIDSLLDEENDLTINQRYLRLKNFKNNGIMNEIQVKTFLFNKGQFIQQWNYPNFNKLKPKRGDRNSNNLIINHFGDNADMLIYDFEKNNNGFFSKDYDCSIDLFDDKGITKETAFVNGDQMKMLWKLSTYIRINNL
ncbi:hypothetical protein C6P42_002363 [Pichia californica]|nr:hypothetical protein C6P42_002363 [[Candida] californica]